MFEPVNSRVDFAAMERETLDWWNDHSIPLKYRLRNRESEYTYSFIDGPITANNPMGVHHAWGRSYKDLFLRFRNMQGYRQRFQNGFDGQGLWIEVEVEKELGFTSKRDIEGFGRRKVRRDVQGPRRPVRRHHLRAVQEARILDGLGQLLPHQVRREQLRHLALPQDLPGQGPDL